MRTLGSLSEEKSMESISQGIELLQEGFEKYTEMLISGKWERLKINTLIDFIAQYQLPVDTTAGNTLPNNTRSLSKNQLRGEVEKIFVKLPALKKEYDTLLQLYEVQPSVNNNVPINLNAKMANPNGLVQKRTKKFLEKYSTMCTAFSNPNLPLLPSQPNASTQDVSASPAEASAPIDVAPSVPSEANLSAIVASPSAFSPCCISGLYVVLDLDETLIRYAEDPTAVINFHGYSKFKEGNAWILVRSYAVEFILNLLAMDCRISILTAGTQAYCDVVWNFLKTQLVSSNPSLLETLDRVVAKSCRDANNNVIPKSFQMVGIPLQDQYRAIAVDNNRMAWERHLQDHVVVIPDWTPETMGEEDQFTFGQVKQRIDQVLVALKTNTPSPSPSPSFLSGSNALPPSSTQINDAWHILKVLYEEEEKQRMKTNARSAMRNRVVNNNV